MAKTPPIRVGVDATPMLVSLRTGIENYAAALIRELAALAPTLNDVRLTVYMHARNPYACRGHLDEALKMLHVAGLPHRVYSGGRGYGAVLSVYSVLDHLDLLHMLRPDRPWIQAIPYVLTIHDVMAVGLSEEGRQIERADLTARKARVIRDAAGLITVSRSTAQDLAIAFKDRLEIPLRPIHHGVEAAYFSGQERAHTARKKYGLERYIFFVGTLQYRKNLPRLIEAFAEVKRVHRIPHRLVLAGRDGWGAELVYQAVVDSGMTDSVLFPGYVPKSDLPGLYAGADVFVYPSLHEGFGIPLLEAMAAETVVYTSNIYSTPEVAGDAAVYVDPYDVNSMAEELWRALSDTELRKELVARGQSRAMRFTWEQTARQTLQFYRDVLLYSQGSLSGED